MNVISINIPKKREGFLNLCLAHDYFLRLLCIFFGWLTGMGQAHLYTYCSLSGNNLPDIVGLVWIENRILGSCLHGPTQWQICKSLLLVLSGAIPNLSRHRRVVGA